MEQPQTSSAPVNSAKVIRDFLGNPQYWALINLLSTVTGQ